MRHVLLGLAAILCVAAIGLDQIRDAYWNAEHQHQCDTKGC